MKNERGVTLVVLMVALLIVCILVGIFVSGGFGRRGVVKETIEATQTSFNDNVKDALLVLQTKYTSKSEYYKFLQDNIYIDKEGKVDVKLLLDTNDCDYGIGSNKSDVYILDKDLNLTYYNKDKEAKSLGNLGATMEE